MKKLGSYAALLLLVGFVTYACKKDKPEDPAEDPETISGEIHPYFGDEPLTLDSVFVLSDGTKIKVTDITCYFSGVQIGNQTVSSYSLFNYRSNGVTWFTTEGSNSLGTNLSYAIGIDSVTNHSDPTNFPNESCLNIVNASDMYWSWSQGFIFYKLEGYADTIVDATDNFDLTFSYHMGSDAYFNPAQSQTISWSPYGSNGSRFKLKLDIKAFFENVTQPINISSESFTHASSSMSALNIKVHQNFASAFSPL